MHVDEEAHGQDTEFEAAFEERSAPPAQAGDRGDDQNKGDADPAEGSAKEGGADEAPADQAKPDPWANATPEMIAERDELRRERDAARHSDASQRGRIAALQRRLQDQPAAPPPPPQDKGKPEEQDGKGGDDRAARIAAIREDYPDLAGPILDLIEEARNEAKALGERVSPVVAANDEAAIARQEQALQAKHPDWREVGGSADFKGWAQSQPDDIRALADSFDAGDVSALLTLFKVERDATKGAEAGDPPKPGDQQRDDRREKQLQGGRERPSRGAGAATGAPDEFDGAFAHFDKKRQAQQR